MANENTTQTVEQQSQELAQKLWAIANDLRGTMDSSKFKDYILGVIFYKHLSEKTEKYMDELLKDDGLSYREALAMPELAEEVKKMSLDHLGYIIEPEYLFSSIIEAIKGGEFTIEMFEKAVNKLSASTMGQESAPVFEDIFDDMDLQDKDLGKEVSDRTANMKSILLRVNSISFGSEDSEMDILGTAYMQLIALFASDAGKKGGEFFTPTCASKLLAKLATAGLEEVKSVCDFCGGSGSLLLQVKNAVPTHKVGHFYSQEYNGSTFNLLRMNMLMHSPYKHFSLFNGDSLLKDPFYENGKPVPMQVQVANPPYSLKWKAEESLLDDPRYSAVGQLAPKQYADLAFVESMVYHMADDSRIAVLLPHGALFRGSSELAIRKYFIENLNCIDAIIGLPEKMFHGTSIPVCVMVLKKYRNGDSGNILFVDASKEFKAGKNQNELTDDQIDAIVRMYTERKDVDKHAHVATLDEIKANDYNLNIPRYVDSFDDEEQIDVVTENMKLHDLDAKAVDVDARLAKFFAELGLEG